MLCPAARPVVAAGCRLVDAANNDGATEKNALPIFRCGRLRAALHRTNQGSQHTRDDFQRLLEFHRPGVLDIGPLFVCSAIAVIWDLSEQIRKKAKFLQLSTYTAKEAWASNVSRTLPENIHRTENDNIFESKTRRRPQTR